MATIALMIGGALLNATAFIGGSYIAKSLSSSEKSDAEKKRHDEALEKFEIDTEQSLRNKQDLVDWKTNRNNEADSAYENFETTDDALKYYNSTHPVSESFDDEPDFSDYYRPNDDQKNGELIYVGGGMLALGYLASSWF